MNTEAEVLIGAVVPARGAEVVEVAGVVSRPPRQRGGEGASVAKSLAAFLSECQAAGCKPILESDPVFAYANRVGLSGELLTLCWREFKDAQLINGGRKKDWRAHFRNAVRGDWYRLWFMAAGTEARLTSKGEQAQRNFAALDAEKAAAEAVNIDGQGDAA